MGVNFFEKELLQVQDKFNETFGRRTICDIRLRVAVILAVCRLGILEKKISNEPIKENVRPDIIAFMRIKGKLNEVFEQIMQHERRNHDCSGIRHSGN